MAIDKVLVVDDDSTMRMVIAETLTKLKIETETAEDANEALKKLKSDTFDMVISDIKMPNMSGIELLKKIKEIHPQILVAMVTAHGSIENAVEAMAIGAFHYVVKPISTEAIRTLVKKAQEHSSLVEENEYLRATCEQQRVQPRMIAESVEMKEILSNAQKIAKSNASVFIYGESGTGKEVVAYTIHHQSTRAHKPYIKVNCAAVPDNLVESEFFGHEKGSFTGAANRRLGRFELAHEGTLLLDEVSEIPIALQAKLLRVTQEQEFERVGGAKSIRVDVRLISTTNRTLEEIIENKFLREDLFYRLNVIPIYLPPLRERREDIIPLAESFIEAFCAENHKKKMKLTPEAKKELLNYPFPGNVRELANMMERVVVMHIDDKISSEHLFTKATLPKMTLKELEKKHILESLQANRSNKKQTAETLGITPTALMKKLKEHNISDSLN